LTISRSCNLRGKTREARKNPKTSSEEKGNLGQAKVEPSSPDRMKMYYSIDECITIHSIFFKKYYLFQILNDLETSNKSLFENLMYLFLEVGQRQPACLSSKSLFNWRQPAFDAAPDFMLCKL